MRKAIYLAVSERLKTSGPGIEFISLWNRNIEQITKQRAWRTPAVFIEFEPIAWGQRSLGSRDADLRVRLHVVTRTPATPEDGGRYQEQAIEHLDTIEAVNVAIQGFGGDGFGSFALVETIPDHEHEQFIHEELIYTTHVIDNSAAKQYQSARPGPEITARIKK